MTTALLLAPVASAGAEGLSVALSGASVADALRNDAYNDQDGGGSAGSFANCQMAVLVNTIVASLAESEGLALVSDDDLFEGGDLVRETNLFLPIERAYENTTAEASCSQDIGAVQVAIDALAGWGEPAPQGAGIAALGQTLYQNGGGAAGLAVALAGATVGDVLENDFDSYQDGGGSAKAATNCQILVAMNTFIVAAGSASATTEASDDDETNITSPPILLPLQSRENGFDLEENELGMATSTCHQAIESLTLVIGDGATIPPES